MKKVLVLLSLVATTQLNAQWKHGLEVGGSNFTGFAFTAAYHFQLSKTTPLYLAPKVGIGHIFMWDHLLTVQAGFDFGYQFTEKHGIAFTTSSSYLINSPWPQNTKDGFRRATSAESGNYLWYTGLDYKRKLKDRTLSFGLGAISMISRYQNFSTDAGPTYSLEDFIPMAKIGVTF
jgi:hypothetical protein